MSAFPLHVAIVDYINKLSTKPTDGLDADSLEVALQCLAESLQVDLSKSDAAALKLQDKTLLEVFNAGMSGASVSSSALSGVPGSAQHWNSFVQSTAAKDDELRNTAIGSPKYLSMVNTMVLVYKSQFNVAAPVELTAASEADIAKAEVIKAEGNVALGKGDLMGAFDRYSEAILLNPSNHLYWANRAVVYFKMDLFEEAVKDSTQAIALNGKYVKAHYRLGQSLVALNKLQDALAAYENAVAAAVEANDLSLKSEIEAQIAALKSKLNPKQAVTKTAAKPKAGGKGGMGGMDFGALLNDPNLMGSLSSMLGGAQGGKGGLDFNALLSNPAVANMMQSMMGSGMMDGMADDEETGADSGAVESAMNDAATDPSLQALAQDPSVQALAQDPKIAAIMEDVKKNGPMAAMKYLSDPEISAKLGPLLGSLGKK